MTLSHGRQRNGWLRWLLASLFITGFLVATYPFYVGAINHFVDEQRLLTFSNQTHHTTQSKTKDAAEDIASDPFSSAISGQQSTLRQQLIGSITIPSIALHIPLFDTTNDVTLTYGATVLQNMDGPFGGKGTHCVIAGHRGLASRVLFTNLDRVKSGDTVILTVQNQKLAYKIFKTQIVQPTDFQVAQREPNQDLLTLVTCTPYMVNSHRLLVTGKRIPYQHAFQKSVTQTVQSENFKQAGILLIIGLAIVLQVIWFWWSWRHKRSTKS